MDQVQEPAITGVEALKLVRKLKFTIKTKDDERNWAGHEHASFDRVELHEMEQALEKLEARLQWSI